MRNPDEKSQIAGFTQLWTRPSVRCVPQVHGWMTLVERHPTTSTCEPKSRTWRRLSWVKLWLSVAEAATWPMTMSMEGVPVRRTCQPACAECAGCARVAGKLRSLRAAEIDELSCCAPSMRQAGSAEEPMRLLSPHACRRTCWEAGDGCVRNACSATRACVIDRAA